MEGSRLTYKQKSRLAGTQLNYDNQTHLVGQVGHANIEERQICLQHVPHQHVQLARQGTVERNQIIKE